MRGRWLSFFAFVLLWVATVASAGAESLAKSRVGAFDFADQGRVKVERHLTAEEHSGNRQAYDEVASGSPLATRGTGGRVGSQFGARSAGAAERTIGRVLQSGGRTINKTTADALNKATGSNLTRREWGRGLEALKYDLRLPAKHHGKISEYGHYLDDAGDVLGNILDYL